VQEKRFDADELMSLRVSHQHQKERFLYFLRNGISVNLCFAVYNFS
jgi:hypothetical protein